ncbi:heterokaryon incompatibility protein-domain-containing protein [Podospora fimiseda]|uniref:Heterokaryon incompatibility protein-domain-containing protein n=1 Tax=Podospora fimiseda TaxID=252190 RepID=A0AAN6YTM6_9PEZI|nr:heterokaryon incompatibility protein-domain-containing protein [Podospora fimiseda]
MAEPRVHTFPVFQHTPLRNSKMKFRLIYLIAPPEGGWPLRIRMEEVSYYSPPNYWALSYTWDSQSPTHPTHINDDYAMLLTANCYAALSQLASEPAARKQAIWVDAICIDQSSVKEKNDQVGMMAFIYMGASNVVIWLGEGDKEAHRQMDDLNRLATVAMVSTKMASIIYHKWESELIKRNLVDSRDSILSELLGRRWVSGLDPFEMITASSWFTRVWTLQEVVLAKKAVVRLGAKSVSWEALERVADVVESESSVEGFTLYSAGALGRLAVFKAMKLMLKEKFNPSLKPKEYRLPSGHPLGNLNGNAEKSGQPGLGTHFIVAAARGCSNLKDKIYGQHAILGWYGVHIPPPDYDKPLKQIYTEAVIKVIENRYNQPLELLHTLGTSQPVPEFPSWVPIGSDWDSDTWVPSPEFCTASGESISRAHFRFSDDEEVMYVKAKHVGQVKRKSESLKYGLNIRENYYNYDTLALIYRYNQKLIRFIFEAADIKGDKVEALAMVLLQEIALPTSSCKSKWLALEKHVKTWADGMMECCDDATATPTTTDSAESRTGNQTLDRILAHFYLYPASKSLSHYAINRFDSGCLFVTDSGLVGVTVDQVVQEGDDIYLIPGVRLPVIIRKEDLDEDGSWGYRLRACPFVHGMMKGELWNSAEGWESELEELRLV